MMGGRDHIAARFGGDRLERGAPQITGGLLERRTCTAGSRGPPQGRRIDPARAGSEPGRMRERLAVGGVEIGFATTQSMVDVTDHELERRVLRAHTKKVEQDARVAPARDRDEHPSPPQPLRRDHTVEQPIETLGSEIAHPGEHRRQVVHRRASCRSPFRIGLPLRAPRALRVQSPASMPPSAQAPPRAEPDSAPPDEVGAWIAHWADLQPDALAWSDGERRCSYREAADRVDRLVTWLAWRGVSPGDRVALWLANRGAVLEAVFACARLGAIALPINSRLTPFEVAFQLADASPRVLLVERDQRARADAAIAQARAVATTLAPVCLEVGSPGPIGEDAYEAALACVVPDPPIHRADPEDPMILMYTSGTTGQPKGALLPHRKTLFNSRNARACFAIRRDDRVLVVAPLFHSLGLQILALPALYCGAGVVIQEGFDAERVWRAIETEGISYVGGVPTAHRRLLDALEARAGDAPCPPRLRFLFTAGAAAPAELIRAYHRRGLAMLQGYGQTETSLLTCLPAERALDKAGSVGRPLPHHDLRVIDPATIEGPVERWRDVLPGEVGEVVVRGPITMLGYWQRPEATRETLRGDWLRTGDLATRDADFDLVLVGRARELYISGGENVYPAEIEAVLTAHPDVEEAAVVAVPDAVWGEVGRAHVVAAPGRAVDRDALLDWLSTRIARFKRPREIVIETALPRTASGKVQKHRLVAEREPTGQ